MHGGVLPDQLAFYPGYGMLLSPVGWLGGEALHASALVLNSLAAGLCVVLASLLAIQVGLSQRIARIVAVLVAIHPSLSSSSRIAWPETLLLLMVLTLSLLVHRNNWVMAGIVTGIALSLHPRMLVLAATISALAFYGGHLRRLAMSLAPSLLVVAFLLTWTNTWPTERIAAVQNESSGSSFVATFAGQWLALSAGTAALATIGLVVGLSRSRQRVLGVEAFIAASALGMMAVGALSLYGSQRIDTLLYGRYIGPWTLPLIIVGLAAIYRSEISSKVIFGAVSSVLVALIIGLLSSSQVSAQGRRIMTLDLGVLWAAFDQRYVVVAVVAAATSTLALLTVNKIPTLTLTILCLLAISGSVLNQFHLRNVGAIADGQSSVAQFLPEEIECLSHDESVKGYAIWLYRLKLPETRHGRIDLGAGEKPCGDYVIADDEALSKCIGAQVLAREPLGSWGLWEYPTRGCS